VLRTGSNYSMERPGHDAVESVSAPYVGKNLALESAYLVGGTVVNYLVTNWSTTRDHIPGN
jgi:purine nucleoside permease